jgi:hypothetical protein
MAQLILIGSRLLFTREADIVRAEVIRVFDSPSVGLEESWSSVGQC